PRGHPRRVNAPCTSEKSLPRVGGGRKERKPERDRHAENERERRGRRGPAQTIATWRTDGVLLGEALLDIAAHGVLGLQRHRLPVRAVELEFFLERFTRNRSARLGQDGVDGVSGNRADQKFSRRKYDDEQTGEPGSANEQVLHRRRPAFISK